MLKTNKGIFLALVLLLLFSSIVSSNVIDTKSVLLKFSLHKGDYTIKNFTISSSSGGEINIGLKGIDRGVTLMQNDILLDEGEEKNVQVLFNTSVLDEGVYVGHIEASSGRESEIIPVVFEVESKDIFFDSNLEIPVKYSEVPPGGKMVVQMSVFDLFSGTKPGLNSSSVDVEYTVHDLDGNSIILEHETLVVNDRISVTKAIVFPKDIKVGQYVFSVVVKYRSSVGIASEVFTISNKPSVSFSNLNGGLSGTGTVLIFIAFIFLVLILFFVYVIRDRDRMFLELRNYNNEEMMRQRELLNEQAKIASSRKGVSRQQIRREIKEKINKIRKKQKQRVKEYRKLKKELTPAQMKKKLTEWKRKGYNTTPMEYKLKSLSTKEMKSIMQKWKEKYRA